MYIVSLVGTATEVEEVDSYLAAGHRHLFDSIINADGGDVLLHEAAFAVPLYDAGFAHLHVAHRN